jgi:hypothetical protein
VTCTEVDWAAAGDENNTEIAKPQNAIRAGRRIMVDLIGEKVFSHICWQVRQNMHWYPKQSRRQYQHSHTQDYGKN